MAFKFNPFTGNFDDVADVAEKAENSGGATTDNAIVRWDGTTGLLIQNSGVTIDDSDNVVIPGDLTVNGTTTTVNSATLDVTDSNITVNNTGNDASAEGAGLTVERTGTDGSFVYEDALASKFKIGALGSEVEVADISSAQTLTNKTIDADNNTILDIANANIAALAAIDFSKMAALTADRVNITNGSGVVTTSTVTSAELAFLGGVSSSIQTQLDAKLDDIGTSTDNALVRWDGVAGEAVQNSLVTLDDAGIMTGLTQLSVDNLTLDGNTLSSTDVDGNIILDPNGTGLVDVESAMSLSSNLISDVADPVSLQDAVTRNYFERNIYDTVNNSGTFNGVNFDTHLVDTSGGVAQVTLPAPSADAFVVVKDKGNANTNNITVLPNGAETIDGEANYIIDSDYEAKVFVSDGTDWFIL